MDIKWTAPEFEYQERGVGWYYLMVIAGAALIIFSVWQRNFLFAIFVILAVAMAFAWSREKPAMHSIRVGDDGVEVANIKKFSMSDFSEFATREGRQGEPDWGKLVLRFKSRFKLPLQLPVPQGNIAQIKELLSRHLSEVEYEESLTEELIRFFKL